VVFGVVEVVVLIVLFVLLPVVLVVQMHENWPMRVLAIAIAMEQLVLQ
jgi:hypothetical protein